MPQNTPSPRVGKEVRRRLREVQVVQAGWFGRLRLVLFLGQDHGLHLPGEERLPGLLRLRWRRHRLYALSLYCCCPKNFLFLSLLLLFHMSFRTSPEGGYQTFVKLPGHTHGIARRKAPEAKRMAHSLGGPPETFVFLKSGVQLVCVWAGGGVFLLPCYSFCCHNY